MGKECREKTQRLQIQAPLLFRGPGRCHRNQDEGDVEAGHGEWRVLQDAVFWQK